MAPIEIVSVFSLIVIVALIILNTEKASRIKFLKEWVEADQKLIDTLDDLLEIDKKVIDNNKRIIATQDELIDVQKSEFALLKRRLILQLPEVA